MDKEELAEALHVAGINAFTHPSDYSAEAWNNYRLKIAEELLKRVTVIKNGEEK